MSDTLLLKLEEFLEEDGWGLPARLFSIKGPLAEPKIKPFADFQSHPCDILRDLWHSGARLPDGAVGLALVVEGYRHLKPEELPDATRMQLLAEARKAEVADEEIETAVQNAWMATVQGLSAADMPERLRKEVRNSVAVLDNGWQMYVIRDRGGEPEVLEPIPPHRLERSRVPHFMWLFLTNQEPTD
jgi:hypothetical protein